MKIVYWKGYLALPVLWDAKIRRFSDGKYKLWTACNVRGKRLIVFREWIDPSWSLQQRLNELENEAGAARARRYMDVADHIRPANPKDIKRWLRSHPDSRAVRG